MERRFTAKRYSPGLNKMLKIEKNKSVKWALDIDGVLCNFFGGLLDYSEKLGMRHLFPLDSSELREWLGPEEHFREVYSHCIKDKDFWVSLRPISSSVWSLAESNSYGPDMYITGRVVPTEWTEEWLKAHGFPEAPVVTVGHCENFKAMDRKLEVLKENDILFYVDDYGETVKGLLENGILCAVFDASHNQDYDLPRVENIAEARLIHKMLHSYANSHVDGIESLISEFFIPYPLHLDQAVV